MRKLLVAFLALGLFTGSAAALDNSADVKVETRVKDKETGHGSGVHIGKGLILTAAHVVDDAKEDVWIVTDKSGARQAEVLWRSEARDIALLRVQFHNDLAASKLACRDVRIGEDIMTVGNPDDLGTMRTWGRVSGPVAKREDWDKAFVAQLTVFGGNSGGPVYAQDGVVGFVVAMLRGTAFTLVVPSTSACELLAAH